MLIHTMRKLRSTLAFPFYLFTLLSFSFIASAQQKDYRLLLKSGTITPEKNLSTARVSQLNARTKTSDGKHFLIIQFEEIPSEIEKEAMQKQGILLLQYIPYASYECEISVSLSAELLATHKARAVIVPGIAEKADAALTELINKTTGEEKVLASFYSSLDADNCIELLKAKGFIISSTDLKDNNIVQIHLPISRLQELISLPFIQYIEKAPPPPAPLNFNSRNTTRANLLQTGLPGDYDLTGKGVVIGVSEITGAPQQHIDFADRLIPATAMTPDGYHSTHVNGTVGGAGLVNELYKGYAPGSTLYATSIIGSMGPIYFRNYGMVLANNSYGTGGPCSYIGTTQLQTLYDQQSIGYPALQNVFGAGNSGETTCSGYPYGFHTIEGSQTSAKGIIAVGSTLANDEIAAYSSKGPTHDGRIKPDIVAPGTNIISTVPFNGYGYNTGTSMSCPAVTGGLALMYQRYRQLHNEQNPAAALMKAILCNTTNDAGNPGPDFSYGFGQMNLYRAVKAIDGNNYFLDSVSHLAAKTKSISIPSGVAQLKILLYWQDPAASIASSRSLVNDLDITVTSPSGTIYLPYRLDTTAANVANPATRREDHVNNIEQVVIDLPQGGNYTITVKGTEIGQNPQQEYYVTYELLPNNILLTFPFGNEALVPGEDITIQWDSWGEPNSTFTLEFSPDNGANWQTINPAIASNKRKFDWQLPAITTTTALIRLIRNTDGKTNTSGNFIIVGSPVVSLAADQCPNHILLQWNAVPGADRYEVMRVMNGKMISVDTTSLLNYIIRNLSADSTYWVTVRSIINNKPGRRAVALSRKPDNGNCSASFFDNNLQADALITPLTGRRFTSTQLSSAQQIIVRIKNLDDQTASNYAISYSVNNGSWISENINTAIPAGATYTHTSSAVYDLSQPGQYSIQVAVTNNAADADTKNDTLNYTIRHLDNIPVNLAAPFIEKFEQATDTVYNFSCDGLNGVDRFDYRKMSNAGRITIPFNQLSDTSGRSLRFDLPFFGGTDFTDETVIGTYNFSAYDVSSSDIGLSFTYSAWPAPGCNTCTDTSSLFIRGNDTSPWLPVMLFNPVAAGSLTNKKIEGIDLTGILAAAGQNFSSSFQVRLSHTSRYYTYLFDDITLYNAAGDIAIASIDSIKQRSCNLGTVPVRITLRNLSKNTATNVRVQYRIDNGSPISETIPSIPAHAVLPYTFATPADLSTKGYHTIEATVMAVNDPNNSNNVVNLTFRNQPLINTFPYLENFENADGFFYTDGVNSSWEYGRPSAMVIKQPAGGNSAWKTNLDGKYNSNELSYLYSPCLDYSTLQNPVVSISLALNIDSCITPSLYCDFMRPQYSTDGINWNFLNSAGFRYNWPALLTANNYYRWHVASESLPIVTTPIQFRFLFSSNQFVNKEGAGIDDFHVYDMKNDIYDTTLRDISITKTITGGNNWVEFLQDQKLVASINSYAQDLGNTAVKPTIKPVKPVRDFHGQYYLNRSFSITAENKTTDSIGIRLYYLDREVDSLLFANNCVKCSKPEDAYRFGVSQYSTDSLSEENDSIPDNIYGKWLFIENRKVKIVPYGKGYYAEFKVKDLSEFRLNSGGPDKQSYLPINLLSFSAIKTNNVTNLSWAVASEINISRYEIEVARGNEAYANKQFNVIGQVVSPGATTQSRSYTFSDGSPGKNGVFYYRLKNIDEAGNFSYSRTIPVLYSKELTWKIFPNPSDGHFTLQYQLSNGERATINIYNAIGQKVKTQALSGNGYVQTLGIDLPNSIFQRGMYLLRITTGESDEVLKLLLQ